MLRIAFENMPFLPEEGRLQASRRACSRTKKGVFLKHEEGVLCSKGAKFLDIKTIGMRR